MTKRIRDWFRKVENPAPAETRASDAVVKRVTGQALDTYAKTFRDLARYDRGEKVLNSVSQ